MKPKINVNGIEVQDCNILASSPRDSFLTYGHKLESMKFPVEIGIDIIFEKYTINRVTCKWRFGENKIYQLTMRESSDSKEEILYKYIWKTILSEIGSLDYPQAANIEKYLFNIEFYHVGIALIDELMKRLREEYKTKKGDTSE